MRVFGAAAQGHDLTKLHQPFQAGLGRARCSFDVRGNPAGGRTGILAQEFNNGMVEIIPLRPGDLLPTKGDTKAAADFLELRLWQPRLPTSVYHAVNAAAPLLNQFQLVEDTTNDAIPQFGDTAQDVLNGEARRQVAGIFHFNAVAEHRQPQ